MSHNTLRRADPKEKVINRAKKLINGNEVGKAQEGWLTSSFVNETNGTVLDVPTSIMHPPPWDLLSQRNIEHLQRLIMKPNPPALEDLRGFPKGHWRKMKIKKARQRYQDGTREPFPVPEHLHLSRGSSLSPVELFLKVLFMVCGAVCEAVIIPGFVLHLLIRCGVCKYSYYSGARFRPCGHRRRVARAYLFLIVIGCTLQ